MAWEDLAGDAPVEAVFITRKFPPQRGGMETVSFELSKALGKIIPLRVLAFTRASVLLPLWALAVLFRVAVLAKYRRITILVGDGALAPLALVLKKLLGTKTAIIIHGLDVTFPNPVYQAVIPRSIAKFDAIVCISKATKSECVRRAIPADKCSVVSWGVHHPKTLAERPLDHPIVRIAAGRRILGSVGRLVRRKGHEWFIRDVMPRLRDTCIYLVIGDGPQRGRIEAAISAAGLEKSVLLIGSVSAQQLAEYFSIMDLLVMPNVPVSGDMEGFGMVAIEAAAQGIPVVASGIEGIIDAVVPGKTGVLVPPLDADVMQKAIETIMLDRKAVSQASTRFNWEQTAEKYAELLR